VLGNVKADPPACRKTTRMALTSTAFRPEKQEWSAVCCQNSCSAHGRRSSSPRGGKDGRVYAHRILKGANPVDLSIFLPTKFELVINLTTAKTLGIDVPLALMVRADEMLD